MVLVGFVYVRLRTSEILWIQHRFLPMRGQITRTKKGDGFQVRLYLGRDSNGVKKFHTKTIHGPKRDAIAYLTKAARDRDMGTFVQPTRQTVAEYLDKWLATKVNVRQRTLRDYTELANRHLKPALGALRLSQLSTAHVQQMVNDLTAKGLSPRTVKYVHDVLKMSMTYAFRSGEVVRNPCDLVQLPRQRRSSTKSLTPEQARAFLAAATADRYSALWLFLIETGLRPGEALGLSWDDIDLDRLSLRVQRTLTRLDGEGWSLEDTKTELSRRTLHISEFLVATLRKHRATQNEERLKLGEEYGNLGLVFANHFGQPLDYRVVVRRHFKPMLHQAGIEKLRPYDLRHTSATLAIELGIPLKAVSERLGHSTVKQTLQTYQHVLPNTQAQAAKLFGEFLHAPKPLAEAAG